MKIILYSSTPSKSLRNFLMLPGSLYYILLTSLSGQDLHIPHVANNWSIRSPHNVFSPNKPWEFRLTKCSYFFLVCRSVVDGSSFVSDFRWKKLYIRSSVTFSTLRESYLTSWAVSLSSLIRFEVIIKHIHLLPFVKGNLGSKY